LVIVDKKAIVFSFFIVRYLDSSPRLWYIDKNGRNMLTSFPQQQIVKEKPV